MATVLYNEMLGSIPDFQQGAVVAMLMLVPSIISIVLLRYLERYNIRYNKISTIELQKNPLRDWFCGIVSGTPLQNTFWLMILCNVVHFFSTPYLMMKNSLEKLNSSWETTASLMGDTWMKTIVRIVTPNMKSTILEVFSYYFVNAMVTVSAVIFIAGARTMVLTTKIKELQYYTKFNEVFVLSLFILGTNLIVKGILGYAIKRENKKKEKEQ